MNKFKNSLIHLQCCIVKMSEKAAANSIVVVKIAHQELAESVSA